MNGDPGAPSGEEVAAALDVLRRAGWYVKEDRGVGRVQCGILEHVYPTPWLPEPEGVREYRAWTARQPWTETP